MITFKQVEMAGFKSFADPTIINFDGGITAIVGPNGCGKSNVADAIRWVLGEQSSKSLRGKTMQDVIFAGTEKRKRLSYCEVSLVFDNSNKWFNIEYDEVVITRKLYRSGESEYYLNRKPCRLKDITDILYDSGVGKDGYSIIGQGKVEEIISSKPEDRRSIFEEATGIAKFKARKTESERKLERHRENLSRLNDILYEVERRLGPLKRQSEDAKKYLELRDILKDLEVNAYVYQYEHASATKAEIAEKKKGYSDNLTVKQNELNNLQIKYDQNMAEINKIDRTISDLHDRVLTITVQLEKRQGESNLLTERLSHIKQQLDRITNEYNNLRLEAGQRETLLSLAKGNREEAAKTLRELRLKSEELSNQYLELIDNITKSEGEKEESQKAFIDNITKLSDIKSNMSALIAKRDTLTENVEKQRQELITLENAKTELNKALEQSSVELKQVSKTKSDLEATIVTSKEMLVEYQSKINALNEEMFAIKTAISNDTNRKNLLVNLQANFEGYQFAVKRLLKDSKENKQLSNAIMGVVGNIIEVKDIYQTAIEIALGASIQNIVTKNETDAKVLINYLKEYKLGRATFLPVSAVKPRSLLSSDKKFLNSQGCLGIASELIKFDEQYRTVVESLLGSTVIVDTLDNAVALSKLSGYAFKIVTLEGDVLTPQGSMSGGSKKAQDSSLLGKENEIKQIENNLTKNETYLKTLEKDYEKYAGKIKELNERLETATSSLQEVNSSYGSKLTNNQALNEKFDNINLDIKTLSAQLETASNYIKELQTKIDSVDMLEVDINTTQKQVDQFNENSKSTYEELKSKREQYNQDMTAIKVQIASSEEKIRALDTEIERLEDQISMSVSQINKSKDELNNQTVVYNTALEMQKQQIQDEETISYNKELENLNMKLSSFDQHKSSILAEIKEIDDKKNSLNDEITRLQNKIFQEDSKLQKVDIDIENMQERIYEEYQLTINDCMPFKREEFDIKEGMISISRTKAQITSLGAVNVHAIEEYKSEGSRFEEMSTQVEDLKKAEEDLVKVIADLSNEMLTKFNEGFNVINENFQKVFRELFGGGNARLEILPSEDPLEAGVEIKAQPPGKAITNISLLSGGEKTMTAIAILFSILKMKPMPFCFLDEIEAALDDANIERYAKYLQRFSEETQFIVITHRKPTMELADCLFGVTMEEKGVSKIVSVRLSEAVKVVEDSENEEK